MDNFDPEEGAISYTVENEDGDRVARAEYKGEEIKTYSPSTMDFFILSFLPKLLELNAQIQVQGPISQGLYNTIEELYPGLVKAKRVVEIDNREYKDIEIDLFSNVFLLTKDLNRTLNRVFTYYKQEGD